MDGIRTLKIISLLKRSEPNKTLPLTTVFSNFGSSNKITILWIFAQNNLFDSSHLDDSCCWNNYQRWPLDQFAANSNKIYRSKIDRSTIRNSVQSVELACGQTLMWMDLIVKVLIWVENLWVALVTKNNVRKETRRLISQEMWFQHGRSSPIKSTKILTEKLPNKYFFGASKTWCFVNSRWLASGFSNCGSKNIKTKSQELKI